MKIFLWIICMWSIHRFTDATSTDICGAGLELTGNSGYLISLNHPNDYTNNLDCKKTISPPSGKKIKFTFLKFDLEESSTYLCPSCRCDSLTFTYGDETNGPLCGNKIPPVFITVETVTITFTTDSGVTNTGFKISWEVIEANCGYDYRPTFYISANGHQPLNLWTSGYTGYMYYAHFNQVVTEVTWTINYNTESIQHSFTKKENWNDEYHTSGPFRIFIRAYGETLYSVLHITHNSDEKVTNMVVTFSADSLSCSINDIQFIDCRTEPPLTVESMAANYKSEGVFKCPQDSNLFPTNKNPNTTCTDNAEWKREREFKCYKAPNDTHIVGNLTIKEHEKMEIYCDFTQTIPTAYSSNFSFGGEITDIPVGEVYTRNITIEDDGKEIWCQPISKYTEIPQYSHEGRSPSHNLHVLFYPRSIGNETHECNWSIGSENSCNFTFRSNPYPDQVSMFTLRNEAGKLGKFKSVLFDSLTNSLGNHRTFTITDIKIDDLVSQRFQLDVNSSKFPDNTLSIQFELNVLRLTTETTETTVTTETTGTSETKHSIETWVYVGIGSGVVILVVILVAVLCRRRNNLKIATEEFGNDERINVIYNADRLETGEKVNPIYETDEWEVSDSSQGNWGETPNSVTNDVTNAANVTTSHEYDLSEDDNLYDNVADDGVYENPQSFKENLTNPRLNNPQELYATVDKEKNTPLQDSSELYAAIDKKKKKTSMTQDSSDLYAEVDKKKKKKSMAQDSSELYAEVDKKKKKKNVTQESSELYAVVNKRTK